MMSPIADIPLLALMPAEVRAVVQASFVAVAFGFGETIVREGDEADALFVIRAGRARVVKAVEDADEVVLSTLGAGDTFGEFALLTGGRRTATVRASGLVEALRLDRAVFDGLVGGNRAVARWADRQRRQYELRDFLGVRSAFAVLPPAAVGELVDAFEEVAVAAGELVVAQDDPVGALYVVREGRLRVLRADGQGEAVTVALLRGGDLFGERSMLTGEPRSASVQAVTDCRLLALAPQALERLMDAWPALRREFDERVARYDFRRVAHVPLDFADELLPAQAAIAPQVGDEQREPLAADERTPADNPADGPAAAADPADGPAAAAADDPADGPAAAADDVFVRPARAIRRFPVVWQIDEADCGAACLAAVCRHFGTAVALTHVRDVAGTGHDGTSLRGLVVGAQALGLAACSLKASRSRLDELALPAICHWEGDHWVVLYATGPRQVRVADPARGLRRIARAEWEQKWSGYCCLLAPTPALADAPAPRPVWRWLLPFLRPHRATLAWAAVLAVVAAALQMLVPVLSGVIVDRAIADHDRSLLHLLALAMLGVLLAAVTAALAQRWLLARMAVRFDTATLDHLTARLLSLPLSYLHTRRTGDLERRLAGMRQIRIYLVQEGVLGLTAAAQVAVAVVLMVVYNVELAGVYLLTVPLYALAMTWSRRRLRPLLASLEDAFGRYQSRQVDAIKGFETVKAAGAEDALRGLMGRQFKELSGRVFRSDLAFMGYDATVQLITFVTLALVLWAGGLLVIDGSLSIGDLVAFNGLVVLANGPIAIVLRLWDELQLASVLLGRIDDVLVQDPEQGADRSRLRPVPTLGGHVTLQGLCLDSPGPAPVTLLSDISLDVAPGTTVALVGRSGAGKTTLVKCLAGLMTPTAGRVLYDGVDLQTLDLRELRRRIGFVLQDDHLFDDTIAANIALGDEQPDAGQVRWAARVADAAEFVERLALGYDTRVGESGLRLSGGQAQRIAIARAVYRRPPVLILDEATSSLDTDSERAVKDQLDELLDGRTAFVIAHRLSTIRNADLIVVLERGRIAEQGSHDELVERRGLYWYLVSQQLDG
ncbi:MAG: ATP-binding cassette, subfamily bacterial [bacterium]